MQICGSARDSPEDVSISTTKQRATDRPIENHANDGSFETGWLRNFEKQINVYLDMGGSFTTVTSTHLSS